MSLLLHGDCLEHLHSVDDNSVDLIFCDLPYGQTSCKWDCKIDLTKLWDHFMRIKKLNTPLFFTTTTKFGCDLIQSAPKKCFFRYDLVWVKSAPAGFLSAKKMPMRKHEMVYVFYEKLPLYDLSSHTHKFIKERDAGQKNGSVYGGEEGKKLMEGKYDPPLPVSVMKEPEPEPEQDNNKDFSVEVKNSTYGTLQIKQPVTSGPRWEPPLPVSVVKEEKSQISKPQGADLYGASKGGTIGNVHGSNYEPPLPISVMKESETEPEPEQVIEENYETCDKPERKTMYGNMKIYEPKRRGEPRYEPPLPTTMLEIKSTRGKHSTEKPVALMEWILKYYSKEGDVVLDPTMGSGSTGVACKNMNRNFIGIEMDAEIYEVAVNRVEK